MSDSPKPRWREFLASPHHAALAAGTLGLGFLSAEPLYFIAGAAAYVVGWIFVPDLPLFRRYLEQKNAGVQKVAEQSELAQFNAQRAVLIDSLMPSRRERYFALTKVCKDIEEAVSDSPDDPRLRKLEELMWTFLRLLTIEESLVELLETETRENVPKLLSEAQEGVERLRAEVQTSSSRSGAAEAKKRLLTSREEVLETLQKRADRLETAQTNLALVQSEQERLEQQIKLIRADSIATRNTGALTARIDATVENLEHTNQLLSQMDQFRDLLTDLPITTQRPGFGERATPPAIPPPTRKKERA
jgi:DNA repair exonuclease SbcCD ATPase subunit